MIILKLITFKDKDGTIKAGWIEKEQVFDMEKASGVNCLAQYLVFWNSLKKTIISPAKLLAMINWARTS